MGGKAARGQEDGEISLGPYWILCTLNLPASQSTPVSAAFSSLFTKLLSQRGSSSPWVQREGLLVAGQGLSLPPPSAFLASTYFLPPKMGTKEASK